MGTSFRCYICDIETNKRAPHSIFNLKSQHSKKPIVELLERFQNGVETIRARDGSNTCLLCDKCIDTIDTYDEACQLAERVENQLKEMIARTEERYKSYENDPINLPESETISENPVPAESMTGANDFDTDPFGWDEMNVDRDEHFDDENGADVVEISEREEIIESEEDEEVDSDDSFAWPRAATLKRKREKEKSDEKVEKKPPIYKCIDCPADYHSKYEMQLHLASHQNSQFRCGICCVRITKGRESIEHEILHSNRPDLQCIFCDQMFEYSCDLVLHMESHNGDVHTICYICGIRIRTQTMDRRHIKSHLGIKDFQCSHCPRQFLDRKHLIRHLRTHTGEKPYECPHENCKKRFSSRTNMKEHTFIHTAKRPGYFRECTICGKFFRRAGLLAEHYQKSHDSLVPVALKSTNE